MVAVFHMQMSGSTKSAFEGLIRFDLHSLGTSVDFVPDDLAAFANDDFESSLGQFLVEDLGALEVLIHKYLGVVVHTLVALFTEPVGVVPAEFPHNVLLSAEVAVHAETHVEVGTALVNVSEGTVLTSVTFLLDEVHADFQIVAEVAPFPVRAGTAVLELFTSFDLGFVVGVGTTFSLLTFPVDKLLAHSIGGQLWGTVSHWGHLFYCRSALLINAVIKSILRMHIGIRHFYIIRDHNSLSLNSINIDDSLC